MKALRRQVVAGILSLSLSPSVGWTKGAQSIVVAFGASQTYGKGVARNETYPAQLEMMLKAAGYNVRVINAGINGDTTGGMLQRLGRSIPNGTKVVILQPGGNDKRQGLAEERSGNVAEIESRLAARGIKVIMLENFAFKGMPRGPDGQHLTPEGYHSIAEQLLSQVEGAVQ